VSAERDANEVTGPETNRDPKVIDVRRDPIGFGGEGNRGAGGVDDVAMMETKIGAGTGVSAAVRQGSGKGWSSIVFGLPLACRIILPRTLSSPETNGAKDSDNQSSEVVAGERTEQPGSGANELVSEAEEAVADEIKMKMLAG
jgi:hypothetical protein